MVFCRLSAGVAVEINQVGVWLLQAAFPASRGSGLDVLEDAKLEVTNCYCSLPRHLSGRESNQ